MEPFIGAGGIPEPYICGVVNQTQEEWYAEGTVNYVHGILSLTYGIVFEILYIPCVIVFLQKDLLAMSVYKIMLFLVLLDMGAAAVNGIITGFLFLDGAVYCNYPMLNYIAGSVVIFLWPGSCLGCLLLVFTRLVDLISPTLHEQMFGKNRIYYMFTFILLYMLYFGMYTKPICFNSTYATWLFDPLIFKDGRDSKVSIKSIGWGFRHSITSLQHFVSIENVLNNSITVTMTMLLYVVFFAVFLHKTKKVYNYRLDSKQKQILIQSCIICLNNMVLAFVYVSFQFLPPTKLSIFLSLFCWQVSSASGVFAFYIVNQTVRSRMIKLLVFKKSQMTVSSLPVSTRS